MTVLRKLTANFVETEIDDEVLLVDLDGGELFSLSGTARATWKLIDGERSLAAIVDALEDEFAAPAEIIARDVDALVQELDSAALIALG